MAQIKRNNKLQKPPKKDLEKLEISELYAKLHMCRVKLEQMKQINKALIEELKYSDVKKKEDIFLESQPEIVSSNYDREARIVIDNLLSYILKGVAIKNKQGDIIDVLTGKIILNASLVRKFSD